MQNKENFYNSIAYRFSEYKNKYDTNRRKEILIDNYLSNIDYRNKKILDCGCGDGYFISIINKISQTINISGCDISTNLIKIAKETNKEVNFFEHNIYKNKTPNTYDIIISSEVIEHCEDPKKALKNICESVSSDGYLILSTPNKLWNVVVKIASLLKLRPFQGYENFLTYNEIIKTLEENNFKVLKFNGIHIYPFQFGFNKFHKFIDEQSKFINRLKINYAFLAKKAR